MVPKRKPTSRDVQAGYESTICPRNSPARRHWMVLTQASFNGHAIKNQPTKQVQDPHGYWYETATIKKPHIINHS